MEWLQMVCLATNQPTNAVILKVHGIQGLSVRFYLRPAIWWNLFQQSVGVSNLKHEGTGCFGVVTFWKYLTSMYTSCRWKDRKGLLQLQRVSQRAARTWVGGIFGGVSQGCRKIHWWEGIVFHTKLKTVLGISNTPFWTQDQRNAWRGDYQITQFQLCYIANCVSYDTSNFSYRNVCGFTCLSFFCGDIRCWI